MQFYYFAFLQFQFQSTNVSFFNSTVTIVSLAKQKEMKLFIKVNKIKKKGKTKYIYLNVAMLKMIKKRTGESRAEKRAPIKKSAAEPIDWKNFFFSKQTNKQDLEFILNFNNRKITKNYLIKCICSHSIAFWKCWSSCAQIHNIKQRIAKTKNKCKIIRKINLNWIYFIFFSKRNMNFSF